MELLKRKERPIRHSTQDQGGPREQQAHRENAQFSVVVRDDGRGGYWVENAQGHRETGSLRSKDGGILRETVKPRLLREIDKAAYAIESRDKELDLIRRERQLIRIYRSRQSNDPVKAATLRLKEELKHWDKATKIGITAGEYLDANLLGIDPEEIARSGDYRLEPITDMSRLGLPSGTPSVTHAAKQSKGKARGGKGSNPMEGTDD